MLANYARIRNKTVAVSSVAPAVHPSSAIAALSRVKTSPCSPLTNGSAFRRGPCEQLLSRDEVVFSSTYVACEPPDVR